MQKFIKNNLKVFAAFILGIVVSGISVYASGISFASGDVVHVKANGTTTTVEAAINELYSIHTSGNAITGDILTGKTAFSSGQLLTGTMNDYSSSTAQTCTKANTSNKLYVKPVNSGYYTANSSFNTGINYNPKGVGGTAATSGTTVTTSSTNVTLNNSDLILDGGSKITIPSGYYSNAINVSSGLTSANYTSASLVSSKNNQGGSSQSYNADYGIYIWRSWYDSTSNVRYTNFYPKLDNDAYFVSLYETDTYWGETDYGTYYQKFNVIGVIFAPRSCTISQLNPWQYSLYKLS